MPEIIIVTEKQYAKGQEVFSGANQFVVQRGPANECGAGVESPVSEVDFCGNGIHVFAGLFAECGASGVAEGMDGFCGNGSDGADLSGTALGRERGANHRTQTSLQDVQRLHDGTAQGIAVGMLSA